MTRTLALETPKKIGQTVSVAGWVNSRRDHGGVIFIDLRDHSGVVQLAIHPEAGEAFKTADRLRDEFVISAAGKVVERSLETKNPNLATGNVEIKTQTIVILNTSKPLPFQIAYGDENVNEEIRLKYRFLDLRREKMQKMLVKRHKMIKTIRNYMDARGFIEITTPILTSSSPEGARDFLVPSRLHPGKFYALPQAPQQFKQLLMVGGVPKYYQIAPCFRDEDPRADRSPGEFYQLDLEISFVQEPEEVFQLMEPLFIQLTEDFAKKKVAQKPFPRIKYQDALDLYGSDKPDLRFDMKLVDLTSDLNETQFGVFANAIKNGGIVKALNLPGGAKLSRSQIDELTDMVKKEGAGGLAYIHVYEPNNQPETQIHVTPPIEGKKYYLASPIVKFLTDKEKIAIIKKTKADYGDTIFFGADQKTLVNKVLGKLRDQLGETFGLKDPQVVAWAWIVDFPMYEWNEKEKKLDFMHNPFSMPQGGLEALQTKNPLEILSYQYDIIANGLELSSGAIRNNRPDIMYKAFEIVGYDKTTVDKKFGAMIRAFEYGAPPHGGFAPGIDRMLMLFENEPNIREVIAFPKNGSAEDVMMGAPSEADEEQLKELHIKLDLPKKK